MATPKTSFKLKSADALLLSPCGQFLLTTRTQGAINVYDLRQRQHVGAHKPVKGIDALAVVPQAPQQVTVTSAAGAWVVMDLLSGQVLHQGQGLQALFHPLHLLESGTQAVFAQRHMRLEHGRWVRYEMLELWDIRSGQLLGERQLERQAGTIYRLRGDHFLMPSYAFHTDRPGGHALCHWQGDPLTAELKAVAPPDALVTHEDRWTDIRSMAVGDDAGPVLVACLASDRAQPVLISLNSGLQATGLRVLPDITSYDCHCINAVNDIVALGAGQTLLFFERSTLQAIGAVHLGQRVSGVLMHPGGVGLTLAMRPHSVHHFDFEVSAAGVRQWLRKAGGRESLHGSN